MIMWNQMAGGVVQHWEKNAKFAVELQWVTMMQSRTYTHVESQRGVVTVEVEEQAGEMISIVDGGAGSIKS
jgi:hypothetical protein